MVLKPAIRNEHRESYREGKFDEIPPHVLLLLEAEESQKASPKKKEKTKHEEKESE